VAKEPFIPTNTSFFTVDLEDWHQAYRMRYTYKNWDVSSHIHAQIDNLLEILEQYSIKATFFCLGRMAEQVPDVVRKIAAAGHEIQSHGYSHRRVYDCTPESFKADILKSKKLLEDMTGKEIFGYRAPEFSIIPGFSWAFNILHECGYRYDSSVYPIQGSRYGWPGFSEKPVRIVLPDKGEITEFPLYSCRTPWGHIRAGGGGAFRLYPWFVLEKFIGRGQGSNQTFYFHPYEFDEEYLDAGAALPEAGFLKKLSISFQQNLFRRSIRKKVECLLERLEFETFGGYLARQKPESSVLLSSFSSGI
jgi:polysaccharide deacetylase family protein (PEP-CTERM system associated)